MDKFLHTYDHSKPNQENIHHLNGSITCNETEEAMSLPEKKSSGPNRFFAEFYQSFKEEQILALFKLFHKIQREGTLPNSIYEANMTLIPDRTRTHPKTTGQSP
jgi:hypothetical protein